MKSFSSSVSIINHYIEKAMETWPIHTQNIYRHRSMQLLSKK